MSKEQHGPLWHVAGKSVQGASHLREGKPCQDALLWGQEDSMVALAVADGHGSEKSPNSAEGAQIAVETAVEMLECLYLKAEIPRTDLRGFKRNAEELLPKLIVRTWRERVLERHRSKIGEAATEEHLGLYGATLLAVLSVPEFLLFLQLGDGDILAVAEDGSVSRAVEKDKKLIANETTSLCSSDAWHEVRVVFRPLLEGPPCLLLLSTDGYSNSFVSDDDFLKVGSDYLNLVREEGLHEVESRLEGWLNDASARGSGDDITVALLYRESVPEAVAAVSERIEGGVPVPTSAPESKPEATHRRRWFPRLGVWLSLLALAVIGTVTFLMKKGILFAAR